MDFQSHHGDGKSWGLIWGWAGGVGRVSFSFYEQRFQEADQRGHLVGDRYTWAGHRSDGTHTNTMFTLSHTPTLGRRKVDRLVFSIREQMIHDSIHEQMILINVSEGDGLD